LTGCLLKKGRGKGKKKKGEGEKTRSLCLIVPDSALLRTHGISTQPYYMSSPYKKEERGNEEEKDRG